MAEKILIKLYGLDSDKEEIDALRQTDPELVEAIKLVAEKIDLHENYETFNQTDNVIATEIGYHVAFWESQLPPSPTLLEAEQAAS
jgi:hypothetical protein